MGNEARERARKGALVWGLCVLIGCGSDDGLHDSLPEEAEPSPEIAEEVAPVVAKQSTRAWLPTALPLPLLDGERDAQYQRAPRYPIHRVIRGTEPASDDLTASWRAIHDSQFLYLFVEVEDDAVVVDSDPDIPWEDDAVELFLNLDGSSGRRYDGVDDLHLIFRPGDRTVHFGLRSVQVPPGELAFEGKRLDDGYQFEIVIPWRALPTDWPIDQDIFVDVHVDDDDDGNDRDHKVSWSSRDDEAWQRPDRFGRVRLEWGGHRPYFAGLGDLRGGAHRTFVRDMDRRGDVLVGLSEGAAGTQAVRWTIGQGLIVLHQGPSGASAVSPDGRYVVGTALDEGGTSRGAMWGPQGFTFLRGGPVSAPGAPPQFLLPTPTRVRDDGVVFGSCVQYGGFTPIGCRYDGPERISLVPPFSAIYAADLAGNLGGSRYPARLEPIGAVAILNGVSLGYPLPSSCIVPHQCRSEVRDFSSGAVVAVGIGQVPAEDAEPSAEPTYFDTGFVYTQTAGMQRLPDYPGGVSASGAYAISDDGRLIAGFGTGRSRKRAVVWVDRKPVAMEDLLRAAGGEVPPGWRLMDVRAMSADGRVFAGDGFNPKGQVEAYVVWLPTAPR